MGTKRPLISVMAQKTAAGGLPKGSYIANLSSAMKADLRIPRRGIGTWKMFCSPVDGTIDLYYLTFVREIKLTERYHNDLITHS